MEVTQTQLLNIGLNIVGFLAAGGLLLNLASLFRRKSPSGPASGDNPPVAHQSKRPVLTTEAAGPDLQFIDLSAGNSVPDEIESNPQHQIGRRRNRVEVYQLAQQMLRNARSTDEILRELPVSDAELDVLKARNSHELGVQNV